MTLPTNPHITYTSKLGREFRLSSLSIIADSEKWVGQEKKYRWKAVIRFLDDRSFLTLESDYNDKIVKNYKE